MGMIVPTLIRVGFMHNSIRKDLRLIRGDLAQIKVGLHLKTDKEETALLRERLAVVEADHVRQSG